MIAVSAQDSLLLETLLSYLRDSAPLNIQD